MKFDAAAFTSGLGGTSPRPSPSDEKPSMEQHLQQGQLFQEHPQQSAQHFQQQLHLQQQAQLHHHQQQQFLQQQQQAGIQVTVSREENYNCLLIYVIC